MDDFDQFDRDIRNAFRARQLPGAPRSLFDQLADLPPRAARPFPMFRLVLGLAATLAVLVIAAVALSGSSPTPPPVGSPPSQPASAPAVSPSVAPSASVVPSTSPTATPEPTPSPVPSAPLATPTPAANVGPAGLIDATHGWAVADQRLVVTADGGTSWQDVNPPAPKEGTTPANLLNAQFLDPDHGWVAFAEPFKSGTDPGFGRIDVWRTTTGGQTWTKAELPPATIHNQGDTLGEFQFDFLDSSHGVAFITGGSANRANDSDLYWTADGGQTWSADRPTGSGSDGVEGTVAFTTLNDGVIAGGKVGSGVSFTLNGGRTWKPGALVAPQGMAGAIRSFGRPVFSNVLDGLVPVLFQDVSGNVTRVYRTTDGGASWSWLSHVPGTGAPAVSIVDAQHWIAVEGTRVVTTANGGASWTTIAATPPTPSLASAQFLNLTSGWGIWTDTSGDSHLYRTSDGAATWQLLGP